MPSHTNLKVKWFSAKKQISIHFPDLILYDCSMFMKIFTLKGSHIESEHVATVVKQTPFGKWFVSSDYRPDRDVEMQAYSHFESAHTQ
jgi:hypothetical protein